MPLAYKRSSPEEPAKISKDLNMLSACFAARDPKPTYPPEMAASYSA